MTPVPSRELGRTVEIPADPGGLGDIASVASGCVLIN